ncbi:DUF1461 domain-containing protein [Dehalococcoidia bacterium]|nr:DUF1461 domain-containing protein [Dehalococcoidia bacterium]
MRILQAGLGVIFVICFPILLFTSGVRVAMTQISFWEFLWDRNEVVLLEPVDRAELTEIAHELIAYFNAQRGRYIGEQLRQTFGTDFEVTRLQEIMAAVQRAYRVQEIILGFVLVFLVIGFGYYKGAFWPKLAKTVIGGSVLTILLLLLMGGLLIFAFEWFWWEFHEIVWPESPYWLLYCWHQHNLIRMFPPPGFWFDASVFLTGGMAAAALIAGGVAGAYLVIRRERT